MLRRCVHIAVGTLSILACARKSPETLIAEHDRSLVSWEQTVRFVGEGWLANDVPSAYARRTLETTLDELAKEDRAIASEPLTPETRMTLRRSIARCREITRSLDTAVVAGDRRGAARAIELTKRARPVGTSDPARHQ